MQHIEEASAADLAAADSQLMRDQACYGGPGSRIFVCLSDSQLASASIIWFGERYKSCNFWQLGSRLAKLVQLVVEPSARGKGIGSALIRNSAHAVTEREFDTCYARVWHSNTPSVRAFRHAGWLKK